MVQNNQESRRKYGTTRSSICSFACTAHLFACSSMLTLLRCSTALICLLARSLSYFPAPEAKWMIRCWKQRAVLYHSAMQERINSLNTFRLVHWDDICFTPEGLKAGAAFFEIFSKKFLKKIYLDNGQTKARWIIKRKVKASEMNENKEWKFAVSLWVFIVGCTIYW